MIYRTETITWPRVLGWLKRNLKKKGPIGVADFAVSFLSDYLFDLRYGTSTSGRILPSQLQVNNSSKDAVFWSGYGATKERPFRKLLERLSFPKNSVFVDVGSGKGKTLLIASKFGFKRVSGVELSHFLCDIATCNVEAYHKTSGCKVPIEIIESDILEYNIRRDENVFFCFGGHFSEVPLKKFLDNVKKSVDKNYRKIWLIFNEPNHDDWALYSDSVENHVLFAKRTEYFLGGTNFAVCESN